MVEQRDDLEREIERQKSADNRFSPEAAGVSMPVVPSLTCFLLPSVTVFRLRARHKQLCQKLQSEEELEGRIHTALRQQE